MPNGVETTAPPSKLENLYNYLKKSKKVKVHDTYPEFEASLNDAKLQKLHSYLQNDPKVKVDKDFNTFKTRLQPQPLMANGLTEEQDKQRSLKELEGATPPFQQQFDQVQTQLDKEGVVPHREQIMTGQVPTAEDERQAKEYVMSVGRDEKERNPLKHIAKTAWSLLRYQIPASIESAMSLMTPDTGNIAPGFIPTQENLREKRYKQVYTKEEHAKMKAASHQVASELQAKGGKLTENLVNTLDKIEDPVDFLNWTVSALTQAGVQIPLAIATSGGSSLGQEIGSIYMSSVNRIAEEEGITPEEVIKQGLDKPAIAVTYGAAAGALDLLGAKAVMGGFNKGMFAKSLRERAFDGALRISIEPGTEYFQTWMEQLGEEQSAGKDFGTAAKDLLFSREKSGERLEATAQAIPGGSVGPILSISAGGKKKQKPIDTTPSYYKKFLEQQTDEGKQTNQPVDDQAAVPAVYEGDGQPAATTVPDSGTTDASTPGLNEPVDTGVQQGSTVQEIITEDEGEPVHDEDAQPQQEITPQTVHQAAEEKGIDYESEAFMEKSKELTGKEHLDDMTPEELTTMVNYINEDTGTETALVKQSQIVKDKLGLSDEDSDALTIIQNANLTPTEKQILWRQWKNGVMNLSDVKKYAGVIDLDKLNAGETDKWINAALSKNKGKKITAEDISFEETTSAQPTLEELREQLLNSPEDLTWEGKNVTIHTEKGKAMLEQYRELKQQQTTQQNAIPEQSTTEVPVREAPGDSETVEQGIPQPEPQKTTGEETPVVQEPEQPAPAKEKFELGKQKVASGLEKLAAKLGTTKSINPLDDTSAWEDVKEIMDGLADMGIAKAEEVIDYLKTELGKHGVKAEDIESKRAQIEQHIGGVPPKKKQSSEKGIKSLLGRAHKGENRKEITEALERHGLTYDVEHHPAAKQKAKDFINEVGIEAAIEAVSDNQMEGGAAAFVWADAIDQVENEIAKTTDPKELERLTELQADLISEFDKRARDKGRFIRALGEVYKSSDFNYDAERQIKIFKANSKDGTITKEAEDKIRELEVRFKEASKKLKEYEAKAQDEEFIRITQQFEAERKNRAEAVKNNKKTINDFFDKLKVKDVGPVANDVVRVIGTAVWNGSIDAMRKATELGLDVANIINAGIEYVKEHYKGADFDKDEFTKVVEAGITRIVPKTKASQVSVPSMKDGKIKIPESMIKKAVLDGAQNINELVEMIYAQIKNDFPEVTEREVRDAITKYGEQKKLSQDELSKKIRDFKTVGRLISALEDVENQIRPLRSGLQRDKLTDEQRRLQRELKEAMKELPVEEADLEKELKSSLDAIKTRLRNEIADIEERLKSGKRTPKRKGVEYDEEANELKAQRDRLKELLKATEGDKEVPLEERINRAIAGIETGIEEYERRIKENELEAKAKKEPVTSPRIEELKQRREELKETLKAMQDAAGITERKRLAGAKESVKKSIDEYQRRIKQGDFAKKTKQQITADDELTKLRAHKLAIKNEFDKLQYRNELANRSLGQKTIDFLVEAWGLTRALRATGEFSFVLLQGGVMTLSHPIEAVQAFVTAMKHFASEKKSEEWLNNVKSQEYYDRAKASKLAIAEPDVKLTAREELFIGAWVNHVWDLAGYPLKLAGRKAYHTWRTLNPAKAVERAGIGYLNTLRLSRYLNGEEMLAKQGKTFKDNPEDFKNLADVINTFTGRASLGAAERVAKPLAVVFFSPRNWVSIMKQMTPWGWYHFGPRMRSKGDPWYKPSVAQKMAMGDFFRYTALTGSIVSLVALMQDDEDEDSWKVEMDPRSSDFLKIRRGNTTIDPWGGRQQMVVLQSRLIAQALYKLGQTQGAVKNYKGEIVPLGIPYKSATSLELIGRMARNKLAPSTALLYKALDTHTKKIGKDKTVNVDAYGKLLNMEDELINNLYPIYWETISELHEDQPATVAGFIDFVAFFGMGTQTYDPVKEREENKAILKQMKKEEREKQNKNRGLEP